MVFEQERRSIVAFLSRLQRFLKVLNLIKELPTFPLALLLFLFKLMLEMGSFPQPLKEPLLGLESCSDL
jgi:hypothetical protein